MCVCVYSTPNKYEEKGEEGIHTGVCIWVRKKKEWGETNAIWQEVGERKKT